MHLSNVGCGVPGAAAAAAVECGLRAIAIANQRDKSWKTNKLTKRGGAKCCCSCCYCCCCYSLLLLSLWSCCLWAKCPCCCSCQCLPPSQSRVEQIKHKMQLWASAKLFNITLSGIIIIHCAAALWGRHTHRSTEIYTVTVVGWVMRKSWHSVVLPQLWKITCNLVYQFVKIIKNMHTLNILAKSFVTATVAHVTCDDVATPLSGTRISRGYRRRCWCCCCCCWCCKRRQARQIYNLFMQLFKYTFQRDLSWVGYHGYLEAMHSGGTTIYESLIFVLLIFDCL